VVLAENVAVGAGGGAACEVPPQAASPTSNTKEQSSKTHEETRITIVPVRMPKRFGARRQFDSAALA